MANSEEQVLPVVHPVTDYEKIKRVGEGTYGVVCKQGTGSHTSPELWCEATHIIALQTKPEIETLGRL